MQETLLLSRDDVAECISMDDALDAVDGVFKAHGDGLAVMPAKITLDLRSVGIEAWRNAMPGFVQPYDAAGIKWAGGYLNNPRVYGFPYVMALIILNDARTGLPLAVMDGIHITNVRTGAAAAVTAKYLARPGSSTLGIIGAGAQGRTTLEAMCRLFPVEVVKVYDERKDAAIRFAEEMGPKLGIHVQVGASCEEAVRGTDIVVTATTAEEPLVRNKWWGEGCTAISLGSYQEFDDDSCLLADKIVVDDWEQCSHRGELARLVEKGLIDRSRIYAELGDVAAGKVPGRETATERIMAVPIGLGTHDIALAKRALDKATEKGLGGRFAFL